MWNGVLGVAAGVLLAACLTFAFLRRRRRLENARTAFFARVMRVLGAPRLEGTGSIGYPRLVGEFSGFPVQVLPVVDTLATRRLPALWLLVTLQGALPVRAKFDLMMRPTGATSFSNFDHLPHTVRTPRAFPYHAVVRTDDPRNLLPDSVVAPHVEVFADPKAKELLITPQGVRIVWLLAEAGRARYGAFREADFGPVELDPVLLRDLLERLVALRRDIVAWARR
jgi:hypothetical protein